VGAVGAEDQPTLHVDGFAGSTAPVALERHSRRQIVSILSLDA
jgi:hypothetical protein